MAIEYCNVTTDLTDVYFDVERYKGYLLLDSTKWSLDAGSRYKQEETGYIEALFEDSVTLGDAEANKTAVDSNGEWFYDSTADILYVQCSDGANPNTHVMEKGVSWNTFKTRCRNNAQHRLENRLRKWFPIPLRPVISPNVSYNSRTYCFEIIKICSILTVCEIIKRLNPLDPIVEKLEKEFDNSNHELEGERPGFIQLLENNKLELSIQRSTREPGKFNVYDKSDLTATAFFDVDNSSVYSGSKYLTMRLQIDTLGAVGTATWKLSFDGGTTWKKTLQPTWQSDGEIRRLHIANGIYVRFVGTFAEGDYTDIECFPLSDNPDITSLGSVSIFR